MKRISYLFIVVLIVFSLITPCFADEVTTDFVETTYEDVATETIEETTEDVPTKEVQEDEPAEQSPTEVVTVIVEEPATIEKEWDAFKEKITDSATWTMLGASGLTIITVILVVAKKFGVIIEAFKNIKKLLGLSKDDDTLTGEIKKVGDNLVKEIKESYTNEVSSLKNMMEKYEKELQIRENNEEIIYTVLTLFIINCKISDSARTEILDMITGVKKYSGDIQEVIEEVQKAIENAKEEEPHTPTLDELIVENYMELG